jgi:hypothetical protein
MPPSYLAPASSRASHCPESLGHGPSRMEHPCPRQLLPRSGCRGNRFRTGRILAAALPDNKIRGARPGGIIGTPGRNVTGSSYSRAPPGRQSLFASWVPRFRWCRGITGSVDGGRMRMAGKAGAGRRMGGGGTRGDACVCRGPLREMREYCRFVSSPRGAADGTLACVPS